MARSSIAAVVGVKGKGKGRKGRERGYTGTVVFMVERDRVAAENLSRCGRVGEEAGQILEVVGVAGNGGRDKGRGRNGT